MLVGRPLERKSSFLFHQPTPPRTHCAQTSLPLLLANQQRLGRTNTKEQELTSNLNFFNALPSEEDGVAFGGALRFLEASMLAKLRTMTPDQ